MAIINLATKPAAPQSGGSVIPSGKGVFRKVPAPKGVIIDGPRAFDAPAVEVAPVEHVAEVFPTRFAYFTLLVVLISACTLGLLLDLSDALRSHAMHGKLAAASNTIQKLFISDIVQDKVSFESRVSLVSFQPRKAFKIKKQETTGTVTVQTVTYKSPQMLTAQVLHIINDSNKRQTQARRLAMSIVSESVHQDYDPLFVAAVIKSESAFNEMAVSNKGAQGLMQIMPGTGKYLAKANNVHWPVPVKLTDAGYNIHLGVKYLKELEAMFSGNRLLTLIAYNWGPGKLDQAIRSKRGVPAECMRYALKILKDHKLWGEAPAAV